MPRRGSIPGLSPAAKTLRPTTNPARLRNFVALLLAKLSSMSSGDKLVATSRIPTWDVLLVDIVPCAIHWLLSPRSPHDHIFRSEFSPGLVCPTSP
ncbi:hypothetical protein BDQ94DRAFT_140887 [Aspergillus welwitschiae]|uniref:Uncharacterized protein n=2 Tax=Aspergillus subgen. Circumdati TaxID=2720871 RepID=A0A3F3Q6N5_9EURO|nr:hypothetical protein BDQ94DRAFT_140887 [Aspergillus welwitschiae]RDH34785.1 hypothetical protein BDQ94DRAFT_140887 [Aspergillus welwitschiae]